MHLKLAVLQRSAEPAEQCEPTGGVSVPVCDVDLDAGALLLRQVHSDVGTTHDRVDVLAVLGEDRDADARLELEEHSLNVKWTSERLADALSHLYCRVRAANRIEQDGVLVTAEPGDHVVGSQRPLDPLGDHGQQAVTDLVPQRVVDLFEAIQVEQAEGDVDLAAPRLTNSRRRAR